MSITHNLECQAQIDARNAAIKEWTDRWPNCCKSCGGMGGRGYSYDPSPSGVGLSAGSMWDFDVCPECVEEGICPRCGEHTWDVANSDDVSTKCTFCGWNPDKPDCCPEPPECFCYTDNEPSIEEVEAYWDAQAREGE